MLGPQTAPRAEMQSRNMFLTYLGSTTIIGDIDIYTDNQAVYNGVCFGAPRQVSHKENADLWESIWEMWQHVHLTGWKLRVHKVKGHATERHLLDGVLTPTQRAGNQAADHWAGEGATVCKFITCTSDVTAAPSRSCEEGAVMKSKQFALRVTDESSKCDALIKCIMSDS